MKDVEKMKEKLIIMGASGQGKVVADIACKMNGWKTISFLDDNEQLKSCLDFEIIGKLDDSKLYLETADFFVAIGNNKLREKIMTGLSNNGATIAKLVHPNTTIAKDVTIDEGTVIMPGVCINSSTHIGKGCIINTHATIEHDNSIGDFVHISPNATLCGTVKVGNYSHIGASSTLKNNIEICAEVTVGLGGVVVKDIDEKGTYIGIPVRKMIK